MAELAIHLDWLRYTVPWDFDKTGKENLDNAVFLHPLFATTGESASIGQGYDSGFKLGAGMVFWHTKRPEQGVSIQLSGSDLQSARDAGIAELDLLRFVAARGGKVSTLHSCIDVKNAGAGLSGLQEAIAEGSYTSRARHIGHYTSSTKGKGSWHSGTTVYIGSPKSAVQIRVYNKAAEQHVAGDWTRIEIVWRGKYAQAASTAMLSQGISAVTRGGIQHQAHFSLPWWEYAMRGETSPPPQVRRRERGTITWLKNAVLPVLEREIDAERKTNSDTLYALYAEFIALKKPRVD